MPLATPIPNDCANRDKKSGGHLSVAGGPGENGDGASGNRAGTKKRNFVDFVDGDATVGLLHQPPSPKRHSHSGSGSGSGHCHYPFHPGWWNGGSGNYASPHRCQNDAAHLLPQQWQPVLIDNRWVQINGHPLELMTVEVWKNMSTPINQPQWMVLNNQWVWMCVHISASEQKEQEEASKKAKLEEKQRLEAVKEAKKNAEKEVKEAKRKAKLEEKQRLEAVKEAKKNAEKEVKEAKRKAKLEEKQRLEAVKEAKKKAKLEEKQRLEAAKRAKKNAELEKLQEELLQKLDDETDERKRSNLKVGLDYSSRLLMEIIDESKDEQTKKKLENWLGKEFRELLQIPTEPTHFQNNY